jgi:hypothetical protein
VDWTFLEGAMKRFGFSANWIKGVGVTYKNAHSKVLVAGDVGQRFKLSRSIRQGCPLAPLLFLIFAEAMHVYIHAQPVKILGIQSLELPEPILDFEFADDITLYVSGSVTNLWAVHTALSEFCEASGALLNWRKSVGLWVSPKPQPNWSRHREFKWPARGETVCQYLGC